MVPLVYKKGKRKGIVVLLGRVNQESIHFDLETSEFLDDQLPRSSWLEMAILANLPGTRPNPTWMGWVLLDLIITRDGYVFKKYPKQVSIEYR